MKMETKIMNLTEKHFLFYTTKVVQAVCSLTNLGLYLLHYSEKDACYPSGTLYWWFVDKLEPMAAVATSRLSLMEPHPRNSRGVFFTDTSYDPRVTR